VISKDINPGVVISRDINPGNMISKDIVYITLYNTKLGFGARNTYSTSILV
jgi:hypothetical protein